MGKGDLRTSMFLAQKLFINTHQLTQFLCGDVPNQFGSDTVMDRPRPTRPYEANYSEGAERIALSTWHQGWSEAIGKGKGPAENSNQYSRLTGVYRSHQCNRGSRREGHNQILHEDIDQESFEGRIRLDIYTTSIYARD